MKLMQRDPNASDKARRAERKADEKSGLITITPLDVGSTGEKKGGFKKGGFKSAFGAPKVSAEESKVALGFKKVGGADKPAAEESDDEDLGYEPYDPLHPTCDGSCGMK